MIWEYDKIGNFCEVTSSKRIFYSEYTETGIPFYRSKEIIEKNKGNSVTEPLYISEDKYKLIKDKFGVPVQGDMLLTSVGTIGIPYVVQEEDRFYFKDGNLTWFRNFSNDLSVNFLYYWISSALGQGVLYNATIGSSQKALTIATLKNIEIPVPPIEIQHRIADILSAYDDLIENNQKQIKLLEEAAQRLYKEWFVDLHFPGYENVKIVDGVPEGWEILSLSDFADIIMGQSPKSEFYNQDKQGLPFHQGVGTYGNRYVIDDTYTTSFTRIAEPNSIIFSVRAPVGRLNITKNKIVIGRGLSALNHKKGYQSYLFYLIKEKYFKDDIIGNGSIFASITKAELMNQKFLIAPDYLSSRFNMIVSEFDEKIKVIDQQTYLLKEARDRLLPKLMSGELEV